MICLETEHQELLYQNIDPTKSLDIHIPSALGPLEYFVCLRFEPTATAAFTDVSATAKLNGLRPTDVTCGAGEGLTEDSRQVAGTDGKVWLFLCRMPLARGDGKLTFHGLDKNPDCQIDLLLCTWRRFIDSGQADDLIRCQTDPQWAPSGVPLGGIGTGRVDICRDGRFRNFSGNNNQDMPFEEPDGLNGAYLALKADGQTRLLATRPMAGMKPCANLEFEPAFPQAKLRTPQILPGIDAEVLLSGTLAPHDVKTSSLPAVLIRWRLHNTSDAPRTAHCVMGWPNLVGSGGGIKEEEKKIGYGDGFYQYWPTPENPAAEQISVGETADALVYTNSPNPVSSAADGRHFLLCKRGDTMRIDADTEANAVTATVALEPKQSATVDMLLIWEMPNFIDTRKINQGLFWQNNFADGIGIADYLLQRFNQVLQTGGELAALLSRTTLPGDIRARLLNCCYPLVTNSVFFKDGRFSINEGPTEMSGCYGTIDQRLGAHPATQLLFPELNAVELGLFADNQDTDGAINHDLGHGHLDKGVTPIQWPDLCCSFVIQHARHAWTTGDATFAKHAWPKVKKAIEKHGKWADEGNGIAQLGNGLGTSYDSYHYYGTTAYMATLWMAALQIARKWALTKDDNDFVARIDTWLVAAEDRLETDLWNGRFYRAYAGADGQINENSHAGMLAGEFFCRLLTGEDVLPQDRLQACTEALMELNCAETLTVPADEAAPETGGTGSLYGWLPYIEAFALTPCALLRHPRALPVWRRMINVMQGENDAHPCDTRLMYRPQSGEPSWGAYYMTAPASWLVYDAMLDFAYLAESGTLRFNPVTDGTYAIVHPRFWALGTRQSNRFEIEITHRFDNDPLTVNIFETPSETPLATVNEKPTPHSKQHGAYQSTPVERPFSIRVGEKITWKTHETVK